MHAIQTMPSRELHSEATNSADDEPIQFSTIRDLAQQRRALRSNVTEAHRLAVKAALAIDAVIQRQTMGLLSAIPEDYRGDTHDLDRSTATAGQELVWSRD